MFITKQQRPVWLVELACIAHNTPTIKVMPEDPFWATQDPTITYQRQVSIIFLQIFINYIVDKWQNYSDFIVLDPIDGTDNFIAGMLEWGVGISIFKNKQHLENFLGEPI